ncbi:MAG: hypothetical protein PHX30_04210 [Candidatus Pacebacteria bacterium]|nr:hypothetical protein [Candidatus Paceibacterota bacterium]
MIKVNKIVVSVLKVVTLAVLSIGVCYLLQKDEQVQKPAAYQSQTSLTPATNQSSVQPGLYRAVYSTCSDGYTDVYVYNIDIDKTEKLFTDKGKDYVIPCDFASVNHGTMEGNVLSFDAKDRENGKDLKLSIDLGYKSEKVTPYDPLDRSGETENIKKVGDLNVILSSVKKSSNGDNILFATDSHDLFTANINYNNLKQVNNFSDSKCVNKGNTGEASDNSWDWVSNKRIFIDDIGFKCNGNGSFLLDANGENPIKAAENIVIIPRHKVLTDDNFVAVVNSGDGNRMVLMNVDTGKIVKEIVRGTQVVISLDGSKMFYEMHSGEDLNKPGTLFVADIDGTNYKGVPIESNGLIHVIGWMR